MNRLLSTFILLLNVPTVRAWGFDDLDYQNAATYFWCEEECRFLKTRVTLKTIKSWNANCTHACALLTFDKDCDVLFETLKETFRNLKQLDGGLKIWNTSFKNLSFFPKLEMFSNLGGTSIANNSFLQNIDSIAKISQTETKEGYFQLSNNPLLNAKSFCETKAFKNVLGALIFGNKVDCGCFGGTLTSKTYQKFKNCEEIRGNLVITDISSLSLPKLKVIYGDLEIANTTLEDLSFFKKLKSIKSAENDESNSRIIINIHDNLELKRFGIERLKHLSTTRNYDPFIINLHNLHPSFCLTIEEVSFFVDLDIHFAHIEASYCPSSELNWSTDKPKLCVFESMANLETGCIYVFGNLLVDSGDEVYVEKLKTVRRVFGSVTIQNTKLENSDFFRKLEKVVNLNESQSIMQILSNKNLESFSLYNITPFITRGNNSLIANGNHPRFFAKLRECLIIRRNAATNISYNGGHCKSIPTTLFNRDDLDFDDDLYDDEEVYLIWNNAYDGFFWDFDPLPYVDFVISWERGGNRIVAVIGLLLNVLHLIVLFQRELRTNFTFMLMIGISICDIFYVTTFIIAGIYRFLYDACDTVPYHRVVFAYILMTPTQEMTRKSSSVFSFLMALFRTCSVMFPTSDKLSTVSKPKWGMFIITGTAIVLVIWESRDYVGCKVQKEDTNDICGFEQFYPDCPVDEFAVNGMSDFTKLIDGYFTVTLALLYLIVTAVLLYQLRIAQKRRKSLKNEKSESTSKLVTLMTITFFLSETSYGLMFITANYLGTHHSRIQGLVEHAQVFMWTFLTFNSTVHCLICFGMSSQYRSVVRRMFWKKQRESMAMTRLVSVTVTKASNQS